MKNILLLPLVISNKNYEEKKINKKFIDKKNIDRIFF